MVNLLNSVLRKKVLTYYFTHIDESYYVRELALLIDEDPGNLSRELKKLVQEGLLLTSNKGNMKLFFLNKHYVLFNEIKSMIMKTEGVPASLSRILQDYNNITLAVIYGSFAGGGEKKGSDIDLILVGTEWDDDLITDIQQLETKINREINYQFYKPDEFLREKNKAGSFLNLVLQEEIIVLKGDIHD